jgi:iron complex outermembrane recepter protein
MKSFFLCCILLKCSQLLSGQTTGKITGQVIAGNNKPVDGAAVSLFRNKDSMLVKTVLTDSAGKFELLNIQPAALFVSVTGTGFKKYSGTGFNLAEAGNEIALSPIQLQLSAASELAGVTVVSRLPFVEKKIDRTVVNPDALIGNAGTNALEVLEKSPGVMVDANGVISLKGKQGVVIFIDDKPTYLSAADLANYLRSLPSSSLSLIEIMTNAPAKYDASGNAGVINLKLKRTKTLGFNGSINTSYGQGTYSRTNNSVNVNYRINKINFFSNASYNINDSYQDLYIKRRYYKDNGELNSLFNQNSYIKRGASGVNIKLGADYYINDKSVTGIVLTGFDNKTTTNTGNTAGLFNANYLLQNNITAVSPSKRHFKNGSININYACKPGDAGNELTVNADYIAYNSITRQSLLNSIFLPDGEFVSKTNLISDLPATIDIKAVKADYTANLKNGARLETGIKTSFISTNNIADFFDEENNVITVNNEFSNKFNYTENIKAAYVNYSIEYKKISFQAGLRFENTAFKGVQTGNTLRPDSSFSRNYNSLFPTLYLSYKLDSTGTHQLGFSFGRRIDRPDYQDLNPFTYPLDRFTLYSGNPFLKPTFSNNLELSHTFKNSITTTFSYSHTRDVISETIEQSTSIFYSRPGNIGRQTSYGVSVNGTLPIKKWWSLQLYTEVMHNSFNANLYNQVLDNTGTYWYIGPVNQFQIGKSWSAELAGTFQTSVYVAQFVTIPVWSVRAGVAKKIFKDKGTIKLNINDLFYSNQPGGDIKGLANSNASWKSYLDSRVVALSFNYRFSKGKGLAARAAGGSDTEKSRVK